jgi:hypothetical protein
MTPFTGRTGAKKGRENGFEGQEQETESQRNP